MAKSSFYFPAVICQRWEISKDAARGLNYCVPRIDLSIQRNRE